MATVAELQDELDQAREIIAALSDPKPKHQHVDPKNGHVWFCSSPYCEPPYEAVKGGGPQTVAAKAETRGERVT